MGNGNIDIQSKITLLMTARPTLQAWHYFKSNVLFFNDNFKLSHM
jgi:hypothetical protein